MKPRKTKYISELVKFPRFNEVGEEEGEGEEGRSHPFIIKSQNIQRSANIFFYVFKLCLFMYLLVKKSALPLCPFALIWHHIAM